MVVEIFKTNVKNEISANQIIEELIKDIPTAEINFDLEDCDKILRIKDIQICPQTIILAINKLGFECDLLN